MKHWQLQSFYTIFNLYLPQTLCEIGTHHGRTACQFVKYLAPRADRLHYVGYDLFEDADPDITRQEHNGKGPGSLQRAQVSLGKMQTRYDNFTFQITQGNTRHTFVQPQRFDFVYIDGGHSYDTVMHDFSMVAGSQILVFDDCQIADVQRAVDEIRGTWTDYFVLDLPGHAVRPKRRQTAMFWRPNDKMRSRLIKQITG